MLNVIVCDDNQNDRNRIVSIVKEFMKKNDISNKIYVYKDYNEDFNKAIKTSIPFKVYLLDIETPSRSGIDIAREIRKRDVESVIIFLTVHDELGKIVLKDDLMCMSFINKFDNVEQRLNKCLKKSLTLFNQKRIIKINDKDVVYTIDISDILYITKESSERKTIIKTDYNTFKVNKSLSEIRQMLDNRFVQTHRACFVNIDRKVAIDKSNKIIFFDNNESIDLVSEKFKKGVC